MGLLQYYVQALWESGKRTEEPIRQFIHSLSQQMFTVLGPGNIIVKKTDENPFLVELSFWAFWVLLLILSLTHWVTWINHLVFLGLSFHLCEIENLERVMPKSLLNLWFYNWLGFSRWPYWFAWNAVPHCHLANTTS